MRPLLLLIQMAGAALAANPLALVYRGPAACKGCPESVAYLLRTCPTTKFDVKYVGPSEALQLSAATLKTAALYAQPGGGGVAANWPHLKPHYQAVRDFVHDGGVYLGNCLGAYFAGTPGFDILPAGWNTNEECTRKGAQVKNRKDTIIQVDYTWGTGSKAGATAEKRWTYFQDGAVMLPFGGAVNQSMVRGKYSSNGDFAMTITPFGNGWVAATGSHVEATKDWYDDYDLKNPDGYKLDIGHDFVESVMKLRKES